MNTPIVNGPKACQWCGLLHQAKCPLVIAVEYFENGRIRRIEFVAPDAAVERASRAVLSDDDLRRRVLQVIAEGSVNYERARAAIGKDLDEIAGFYGIDRNNVQ